MFFPHVLKCADHFSVNDIEQCKFICNQNLCNLGNKLGGQYSYDNQQNLSQCNNVSLHSQSFGNPSDYVFSDGGEGGSMNGCVGMPTITMPSLQLLAASGNGGGRNSVGIDNTEIVSSGLDGQNESNEIVPRKTVDRFGQRTSTYRAVTRFASWSLID